MTQTLVTALHAPDSADVLLPSFEVHDAIPSRENFGIASELGESKALVVPEMCLTDEQGHHESIDWFRDLIDMAEESLAGTGASVFAPAEISSRIP